MASKQAPLDAELSANGKYIITHQVLLNCTKKQTPKPQYPFFVNGLYAIFPLNVEEHFWKNKSPDQKMNDK